MTTFNLPDLGEGLQEAEVVAWHVGVGDHVVADQPLVSVETEKAVVEIPSPQSGRIAELFAGVGDIVRIGAHLVSFEEQAAADTGTVVGEIPGEAPTAPAADTKPRGPGVKAAPAVRKLAQELGVDLATVSASGPDGTVTKAMWSALPGPRREGGRWSRCAACAVSWPGIWHGRMRRWCRPRSPTRRS